ncbi:MAG: sugar-binding protein [Armatimonadota bacterium]
MIRRGVWIALVLGVSALVAFGGCKQNGDGAGTGAREPTVARAAAKLPNVDVAWRGPDQGTVQEQKRILETFEAEGVDAISISPRESAPLETEINRLIEKGVLVICMDSDAPNSNRLAYIGTNNYEAGKVAGHAPGKVWPDGAKVMAFVGDKAAQNARERLQGFEETARTYGIDVVDVMQDDALPKKARRNAEDIIQSHPEVNGFLGLWSYDAPAITQAVIEAGKQDEIKIVSFDAEPQTIELLEQGAIEATVVQKPYMFGYLSVELLYMMKTMGVEETQMLLAPDGIVDTGVRVVTPENVGEFKAYLDDLGVESS